jgi:hypothetical protein
MTNFPGNGGNQTKEQSESLAPILATYWQCRGA